MVTGLGLDDDMSRRVGMWLGFVEENCQFVVVFLKMGPMGLSLLLVDPEMGDLVTLMVLEWGNFDAWLVLKRVLCLCGGGQM